MKYQSKMLLVIITLPVLFVLTTAGVITWRSRRQMLDQAVANGIAIAALLGQASEYSRNVPLKAEADMGKQMAASATILAHLVDVAENLAGQTPQQIMQRLKSIVAQTSIAECWVTDEKGHAYLTSVDGVDFTFSPDPREQPQAHEFFALLNSSKVVMQELRKREIDDEYFKYVGVSGIDKPRIVEIGSPAPAILEMRKKLGLETLVHKLVDGNNLVSLEVTADQTTTVAFMDAKVKLSPADRHRTSARIIAAQDKGEPLFFFEDGLLEVIYPQWHEGGEKLAIVARLSTEHVQQATHDLIVGALRIASMVLIACLFLGLFLSRQVTRPVNALSAAALAIETDSFKPAALDEFKDRPDEIGNLSRAVIEMAKVVRDREQALNRKVEELQIQIDERKKANDVREIVDSDHFKQLLARVEALRGE